MKLWWKSVGAAAIIAVGTLAPVGLASAAHHLTELKEALSARSEEDRSRDEGRKPAEVVHFIGIKKGDTVVDLMASGGWYTEVLSIAVGESGKVYAQNPQMFLEWNDGFYEKALSKRLEGNRLSNVERIDVNLSDSDLAPGTIDAALTALNFHDLYNSDPAVAVGALKEIRALLKAGGVLGLIDHHGDADKDNTALHRMHVDLALKAATEAGFEVDDQSDLLANPEDDRTKGVFDPAVRGKTDRFLLRLKNPS